MQNLYLMFQNLNLCIELFTKHKDILYLKNLSEGYRIRHERCKTRNQNHTHSWPTQPSSSRGSSTPGPTNSLVTAAWTETNAASCHQWVLNRLSLFTWFSFRSRYADAFDWWCLSHTLCSYCKWSWERGLWLLAWKVRIHIDRNSLNMVCQLSSLVLW